MSWKEFSMSRFLKLLSLALCLVAALRLDAAAPETPRSGLQSLPRDPASIDLPLTFVANEGQFDQSVRFYLRDGLNSVRIGAGEVALSAAAPITRETATVQMHFVDSNPSVEVEGWDRQLGVANFYHGDDPKLWVSGVSTFAAVAQPDLYPGITQTYRSTQGELKSEFLVAPGADPSQIRIQYSGAEQLVIADNGELVIRTPVGEWRESAPIVYQQIGSQRIEVSSSFRLLGQDQVGFYVADYDPSLELVIDPKVTFSTFLGGTSLDLGGSVAVDSDGNVLVIGSTESSDFPLMNPAFGSNAGGSDIFVSKLDRTGSNLLYSTYIGGSGREFGTDITVDSGGNAYGVGWTNSSGFPTTPGVFQSVFAGGGDDAAVFKLDPAGQLIYSTFLGGSGDDQPEDIAVDATGQVFVMGNSSASTFPTTPGAFSNTVQGVWDVFVTKLNATGTAPLVYSTFIGGSGFEEPKALALDGAGNAYITGRTQSMDYPIAPPDVYDPVYDGIDTAFLTKLDATGASLSYSTFLDGISPRFGASQLDVAVDPAGNAYIAAPSEGSGFPSTPGAYDTTFNAMIDAVVMKVRPDGKSLEYSTFLGGSGEDRPNGIVVDGSGGVFVAGSTTSSDFPLVNEIDSSLDGGSDVFLAHLDPSGRSLLFGTYYGGSNNDAANGIALGDRGVLVTGSTSSADFPTGSTPPFAAFQPSFAGGDRDAIVACIAVPRVSCFPEDPLSGNVLRGSGNHLPIPVNNPGGNPDRIGPAYAPVTAGAFTGNWSSPANTDWHGTFDANGVIPGMSGPGPGDFDFTTLTSGLPMGTILVLGDLDAGSGPNEAITFQAFDASNVLLDEWLNEPFAMSPTVTPTSTPAWDWDGITKTYRFIGSGVPGNPSDAMFMRTNQAIHSLSVSLESIGFGYAIDAPRCRLFHDGFESGDTSAWTLTVQ